MTQPGDRTPHGSENVDHTGGLEVDEQPGPRDEGGSGGMASREQEAREERADGG